MPDPLVFIIDALAVFRLARLLVADTITAPMRAWAFRRWPGDETVFLPSEVEIRDGAHWIVDTGRQLVAINEDEFIAVRPSWLGRWLECVWCTSVWLAPAVIAARVWLPGWQWIGLGLAYAAVAGVVHFYSHAE